MYARQERLCDNIVNVFTEGYILQGRSSKRRFRETGNRIHKSRTGRPRRVGQGVESADVLTYALAHPQSSTREIREHRGLTKSSIWTTLNEIGAHPYRPTHVQALMPGDAQRRYDFCNFNMNRLQIQPTFLGDIIWCRMRRAFRIILCTISRTSITGLWKILDALSKFDIKYAGR